MNDTQVVNKAPLRSNEDESPTVNGTGNPSHKNVVLGPLTPLDRAVALLTSMVEGGTLTEDEFFVGIDILSKNPDQLSSILYSNDSLRLRWVEKMIRTG